MVVLEELGRDPDLLAGNAGGTDTLANLGFVLVAPCAAEQGQSELGLAVDIRTQCGGSQTAWFFVSYHYDSRIGSMELTLSACSTALATWPLL